ncbi:MAG: hypothetical protein ACRDNJ_06220 [Solirubrobacteraceae bacterium]
MQYLLVLVVVGAAVFVITGPLRAARRERSDAFSVDVAELEAARDAKYREIQDAELDLRTGKLSEADYQELDLALRAEAVEILHRLDRVRGLGDPIPSQQ